MPMILTLQFLVSLYSFQVQFKTAQLFTELIFSLCSILPSATSHLCYENFLAQYDSFLRYFFLSSKLPKANVLPDVFPLHTTAHYYPFSNKSFLVNY